MTPAWLKTLMTVGSALAGAAMFVPQLAAYQGALGFLAGALGGGAHVPRPGDLARAKAATDALAKVIEGEK